MGAQLLRSWVFGPLAGTLARIGSCLILAATSLVAQNQISSATSFNVDFGNFYGAPSSAYGGYANQAGIWNVISATGSTNLVDLAGAALPGVALNLSSSANPGGFVGPLGSLSTNDRALIGDNFYTIQANWSVTLSGLQNGLYNLFVYAPANIVVPTSSYVVNGITQSNLFGSSGSTTSPLQLGINYAIDSVLVTNGSIVINSGVDNGVFSGLAGLQLTPTATPIPAALPLFAGGLGILSLVARRRNRKVVAA